MVSDCEFFVPINVILSPVPHVLIRFAFSFYSNDYNSCRIEDSLTDLGWKRLRDKHDDSWKLKWTECKSYINFNAFREGNNLIIVDQSI